MTDYPEHDKLKAVSDKSRTIAEFLAWLSVEKEIVLAVWVNDDSYPVLRMSQVMSDGDLVLEHFGIDPRELEIESRMMLDKIKAEQ